MRFRAKVDSPWCKKGEMFMSNLVKFDPREYPDLFAPIREKSNEEKWFSVIMELGGITEIKAKQLSKFLNALDYDVAKAFKKVLTDEDKWTSETLKNLKDRLL
jgi:hypothetical protein